MSYKSSCDLFSLHTSIKMQHFLRPCYISVSSRFFSFTKKSCYVCLKIRHCPLILGDIEDIPCCNIGIRDLLFLLLHLMFSIWNINIFSYIPMSLWATFWQKKTCVVALSGNDLAADWFVAFWTRNNIHWVVIHEKEAQRNENSFIG